jgi:tellurium resistance protein TerD
MSLATVKTGSRLQLNKNGNALSKLRFELFWGEEGTRPPYDLDIISVETQNQSTSTPLGVGISEDHVCYWGQLKTPSMNLDKDNRNGKNTTGEADETIRLDLSKLDNRTTMIPLIVNIDKASALGQDFSQVNEAYAVVYDDVTNSPIARVDFDKMSKGVTGVLLGAVVPNQNKEWEFSVINQGFIDKSLKDFFSILGF